MGAWVAWSMGARVPDSTATVGSVLKDTNSGGRPTNSCLLYIIMLEFVGSHCYKQGILYLKHTNPRSARLTRELGFVCLY